MANRFRDNSPSHYRDDDRPYGRNQYGPRGYRSARYEQSDEYGYNPSAEDRGSNRWQHEQDYYGSATYNAGETRDFPRGSHTPDYSPREYGHRDRGQGQTYAPRERDYATPYGAQNEYQTYAQQPPRGYALRSQRPYGTVGAAGYSPDSYRSEYRGSAEDDRGFFARAGDEVMSWFGDDDAARRREMDQRDSYGTGAPRGFADTNIGRGPKDYFRSDDRIREDICDQLTDDWKVDASDIEVRVQSGEVTLSGSVKDRETKRRVEDCADRISGVKQVQNNLRVEHVTAGGLGGIGSRSSDRPSDRPSDRTAIDKPAPSVRSTRTTTST